VNRRYAVAGVAALLLLLLAIAFLDGRGHRGPLAAQRPSGVTSPGSTSAPAAGGGGHASPAPSGARPGSSGSPGPGASASSPAGTSSPMPAGTPTPSPAYVFNPQPSASGTNPATHFLAGDLTLPAGQQLVAKFDVSSAGSVSLHAFPDSSTYPVNTLLACFEYVGQAACNPAGFPNPAYWTISAGDLAHYQSYQLRVVGTVAPGGRLVGMDFGWNSAHHLSLAGVDLPGVVCSGAGGYVAGCGVRFKLTSGSGGNLAAGVAPAVEIHLKVQDKSTGTVACDVKFFSSTGCPLPYAALWTGHLYPETGQAVPWSYVSFSWP